MKQLRNIPDWLPNPRDLRRYPDPENAPLERWAWEFLRRNPEYRQTYADLEERANQLRTTLSAVLNLSFSEWKNRSPNDHNRPILELAERYWEVANRFWIRILEDPSTEYGPDHYRLFKSDSVRIWYLDRHPITIDPPSLGKRTLVVELDPSRPWNLQVESVRYVFRNAQKYYGQDDELDEVFDERNVNPRHWLDYLRILDACERGESHASIAKWLLPPERWTCLKQPGKSITRMFNQACDWRDHKYKQMCAPRRDG